MFSGALGAVGVAATVGVLDQPPNVPGLDKTSLVGEKITGGNLSKKPGEEKVAILSPEKKPVRAIKPVVTPSAIIPSFDLLRVEKNGSTLIAGHAQPDTTIEIFDGVIIVATTKAGSNGDFVAILEKPLSPGDHHLGIRSTGKDNKILVSAETGLVSVPVEKNGELLAMVMKPGEASRIVQKPAATKPAKKVVTAKLAPVPSTVAPATMPEEKAVEISNVTPETKTEVALETPVTAQSKSPVIAKVEAASAPAMKSVKEPVVVAKSETKPVAKIAIKDTEPTAAKVEPAKDAAPIVVTKATKEQQIAALVPPKKPAVKVELEKAPTIIVEAVEIDGPIMFIAGAAEPGRRVAVYVDNKFVGFVEGSREGRFLLEVERQLSRGEHLVRADIYDAKGVAVASRAEVPLIHEPEELAVDVAKVEKPQKVADKKAAPAKKIVEIAKVEVGKASASPSVTPVAEPKKETVASSTPSASITKKTVKAIKVPLETTPETPKKAEAVQVAIAKVEEKPADKSVAMKPKTTPVVIEKTQPKKPVENPAENTVREVVKAIPAIAPEKPVLTKTVETAEKIIPAPVQPPVQAPAKEMETAAQPVLETKKEIKVASAASVAAHARRVLRTGSSVIIRRGDSLWRISYRTYGRGIRYSTIYQANLSQLRSPHRIYPGQILKVPKKKFKQQG